MPTTPKKILFYTDTPIYGGAEKQLGLLLKALPKTKFHPILACSNFPALDELCKEAKENGVEVVRFSVIHKHDPRHFLLFQKLLNQSKPDLIHLQLWNPGACRYAYFASILAKKKIIATEHCPFTLIGNKRKLKEYFLKHTALTITVSKQNAEFIKSDYANLKPNVLTIPNSIDLNSFQKKLAALSPKQESELRNQILGAKPEEFLILSVAALQPHKGLPTLLNAFAELNKTHPQTHLAIVGDGPEEQNLKNLITSLSLEGKVTTPGYQPNIPQIMKCADLFVLPSLQEAFGLVLIEAQAAHLPVISTTVGGIPEVITHNLNGLLVKPEQPKELAQAITQIIESEELRKNLTTQGFENAQKYNLDTMINLYTAMYENQI